MAQSLQVLSRIEKNVQQHRVPLRWVKVCVENLAGAGLGRARDILANVNLVAVVELGSVLEPHCFSRFLDSV